MISYFWHVSSRVKSLVPDTTTSTRQFILMSCWNETRALSVSKIILKCKKGFEFSIFLFFHGNWRVLIAVSGTIGFTLMYLTRVCTFRKHCEDETNEFKGIYFGQILLNIRNVLWMIEKISYFPVFEITEEKIVENPTKFKLESFGM